MTKAEKLKQIVGRVAKCTRCDLYKRANKPVPGEGSPNAKVMFIGEGPGYWEDQKGIPFCGPAGKLLDQLLSAKGGSASSGQLINLSRKNVFITNIVKHRPPNNRDPLPEEIEACSSFLDEQIQIIEPKIIVSLGRFSMNKFLPGEKISQIHGQARFVDFLGKRYIVIPMYHPAAALRSGKIMEEIKEDFKKIKIFLEENPVVKEKPAFTKITAGKGEKQLKLV